jgi:hypothetical protein
MEILFILGITVILALGAVFINNGRALGIVNFLGHLVIAAFSLRIVSFVIAAKQAVSLFNFFYIFDRLHE